MYISLQSFEDIKYHWNQLFDIIFEQVQSPIDIFLLFYIIVHDQLWEIRDIEIFIYCMN